MDIILFSQFLKSMKSLRQKNVPVKLFVQNAAQAIRNAELNEKLLQKKNYRQ